MKIEIRLIPENSEEIELLKSLEGTLEKARVSVKIGWDKLLDTRWANVSPRQVQQLKHEGEDAG